MPFNLMSLVIFLLALGGMIFLHELGHYLASRWAGVEVEEFGFGFPPRALAFWRGRGHLIFDGRRVEIPQNLDLNFDWLSLPRGEALITVDQTGQGSILRTLEITGADPAAKAQLGSTRGTLEIKGVINEVHPGTIFSMNWLPLGGFVRPKGENEPNVPGGLASASPWKRLVVLFAGPLMNLVTAVVVFSLLVAFEGVSVPGKVKINAVTKNSPAEQAGIQAGDLLTHINGVAVEDIDPAIKLIQENLDKPVALTLERGGTRMVISATPLSSRPKSEGALGIGLTYPTRPATAREILTGGVAVTGIQAATILYLPFALLQGAVNPEDTRLVGFKGIFDMFNIAVREDVTTRQEIASAPASSSGSGAQQPSNWTLSLIGMLSVSLGVMNLLPIPALDGGRILFTLPEILFHKRIPSEWENRVNAVAMLLLIGLMLFVNAMDFINPAKLPLP